jgi:drug/metabolite transporter (DMT)-like permease
MKLRHGQAVALMVLVTALWSTAGVVTRHLEAARSFELTFWRSLFTLLSLLVILPVWQGRAVFARMPWRSRYLWLSGVCWSVMFTAFMVALTLTAVANVLITMALGPLITALFTWAFLRQPLPWRTWMAIVVAGVGIAWMYGSQLSLSAPHVMLGSLVALGVPLAGAVQWTLVQKSHAEGQDLDLVPSVMVGAAISTAVTVPLALPLQASGHDIAWLAALGLFQLAIPCALSVLCARVLKAAEVSLLALLEIVFGILLAWLGANEAPQSSVLLGGALVLGALAFNEWWGWRHKHV